ncbi:hypothetical protein FOPE_02698 [Fonsecaea pedrosoi]|nr:hypothetical protein FOPE_02698 [Fonsecaea pedrosoi]
MPRRLLIEDYGKVPTTREEPARPAASQQPVPDENLPSPVLEVALLNSAIGLIPALKTKEHLLQETSSISSATRDEAVDREFRHHILTCFSSYLWYWPCRPRTSVHPFT